MTKNESKASAVEKLSPAQCIALIRAYAALKGSPKTRREEIGRGPNATAKAALPSRCTCFTRTGVYCPEHGDH